MALPAEKWVSAPKAAHTLLSLAAVVLRAWWRALEWVLGFSGSCLSPFSGSAKVSSIAKLLLKLNYFS